MAKKRPVKKAALKKSAPQKSPPQKPAKTGKGSGPAKEAQALTPVVFFSLRDAGTSAIRYHSDHPSIEQARSAARMLANSSNVADVWIIRDVEILRGPS